LAAWRGAHHRTKYQWRYAGAYRYQDRTTNVKFDLRW
jgi:hypothetical protein